MGNRKIKRIYLIFAERQAMRRTPMYMEDWIEKLHSFLKINDRDILFDAGKISHEEAIEKAEKEYDIFHAEQNIKFVESDFDKEVKKILDIKGRKKLLG